MIFPALQPACLIYNRSYKLCTAKSFEMAVFELQKSRINSDMLSRYISRPICFVGRVEKLDEELSGVVEVLGMVSNKGTIMASAYNILREDKGIPFDLELYNDVLKVIHDFPQHYPFEIATSG